MAFLFAKSFPFCVAESALATGSGTKYPFAMSLKDVMSLFWKFESFSLTGNYSLSFEWGTPASTKTVNDSYSATISTEFISFWPHKMSDMICPVDYVGYPLFYGFCNGFGTSYGTGGPYPTTTLLELNIFRQDPYPVIKKGELFYPNIYIGISTDLEYSAEYSSIFPSGSYIAAPNMFKITINGNDYLSDFYATADSPASFNSFNGQLAFSVQNEKLAE